MVFWDLRAIFATLNKHFPHKKQYPRNQTPNKTPNMANSNLSNAKNAKNDEFYTQYADIEKEIMAYLEYNPEVFRNKTILLPCDDPEWSNFTKFFAQNFERFGLQKLISTSYAHNSKNYKSTYQPTIFETKAPHYDETKTIVNGKIFTLTADNSGDNKINIDDLQWQYLAGDGDFRSKEIKKLRDEADIIITNPPFSLFREFLAWIVAANKQFVVIGSKNAITYKEVFPLIKDNKMWVGTTSFNKDMLFISQEDIDPSQKPSTSIRTVDGIIYLRSPSVWFTNIEHGRRHNPLPLMTMEDNLKFNKKLSIKNPTTATTITMPSKYLLQMPYPATTTALWACLLVFWTNTVPNSLRF